MSEVDDTAKETAKRVSVADSSSSLTTASVDKTNTSNKRSKTHVLLSDVLNADLLTNDSAQKFQQQYATSKPYPHCQLPQLFQPSFLKAVQLEIKDNSKVNFKESDLFKVFQSMDLANLDPNDPNNQERLPHVLQLRQVLYSDEWRTFIESVCALPAGTLNAQVDCACNCHAPSGHLLCHDDVIGTRKVSYILYLTEDEPTPWTAKEGGALELYDSHEITIHDTDNNTSTLMRVPDSIPCKQVVPVFNSMAFFVVEPGVSFHAVQEVWGERPRLSLQGWYHADSVPDNYNQATLQRLKSMGNSDNHEFDFTEYPTTDESKEDTKDEKKEDGPAVATTDSNETKLVLKDVDREYLKQYIDEAYLKPDAMKELCERFEQESSVQLRSFLNHTWKMRIREAMQPLDRVQLNVSDPKFYHQGVSDTWKLRGPSHMQRYLEYQPNTTSETPESSAGDLLHELKTNLLESQSFRRYLAVISSLGDPTGYRGRIRRFRPGRDYTVAHYGLLSDMSILDATLCFVAGSGKEVKMEEEPDKESAHDLDWQSGECGGFECYIAADDDEEAADEYNQDDDTELLSVSASNNTLSLVYRDPGTMRFVKYLSCKAPSSRFDISMEYQVEQDEEDDEENGKEEEIDKQVEPIS